MKNNKLKTLSISFAVATMVVSSASFAACPPVAKEPRLKDIAKIEAKVCGTEPTKKKGDFTCITNKARDKAKAAVDNQIAEAREAARMAKAQLDCDARAAIAAWVKPAN